MAKLHPPNWLRHLLHFWNWCEFFSQQIAWKCLEITMCLWYSLLVYLSKLLSRFTRHTYHSLWWPLLGCASGGIAVQEDPLLLCTANQGLPTLAASLFWGGKGFLLPAPSPHREQGIRKEPKGVPAFPSLPHQLTKQSRHTRGAIYNHNYIYIINTIYNNYCKARAQTDLHTLTLWDIVSTWGTVSADADSLIGLCKCYNLALVLVCQLGKGTRSIPH